MKQFVGEGYTVYKHTNKVNGKSYIGQTKHEDLTRRWTGGNGYKKSPHFYRAIKKYGWNGFTHEILETGLTKEEADEKEIYYIKHFRTTEKDHGYNMKHGGHHDGTLTEETRQRFKVIYAGANSPVKKSVDVYDLNGKYISTFVTLTEAARYIGCTAGSVSTKCTKKSGTVKGYIVHFHETTNGIAQLPPEMIYRVNDQRKRNKKVAQYTLEGYLINIFASREEAAKCTQTLKTEIAACIKHKTRNYANGFIWRNGDDAPEKIEGLPEKTIANIRNGSRIWANPIIRKDVKTNEIKEFTTQREAAKEHNVAIITITRWLNANKPMHGYLWEYKYA